MTFQRCFENISFSGADPGIFVREGPTFRKFLTSKKKKKKKKDTKGVRGGFTIDSALVWLKSNLAIEIAFFR